MGIRATAALLLLASTGCVSTFAETHYFRSKSPTDERGGQKVPNYFRLKVTGSTWVSSARYVSGYYDQATLETYFNEFSQPANGALRKSADRVSPSGASVEPNGDVEPLSGGLEGKQLVLILSSNSDQVASQIEAVAQSNQLAASLVAFASRDEIVVADEAARRLEVELARSRATSALASGLLKDLVSEDGKIPTKDLATGHILTIANAIAADLGHRGGFGTLKDLDAWFAANRANPGGAR